MTTRTPPRIRFRLTIRQLLKLVAVVALMMTLLRLPVWQFLMLITPITWGLAIHRSRRGQGPLVVMQAVLVVFVGMGIISILLQPWSRIRSPVEVLVLLLLCTLAGLVLGAIVGGLGFLILLLLRRPVRPVEGPPQIEEVAPIAWRGLCNDQRSGGTRP